MHKKLWRCAKMHIWALTYFEEVGHITECCYFDAMNFFWSDYCSPKWELEVQHSGHMWVQCLPMRTKWQCMPMGMKVQHSGHMSAMRLKFPFSMFQRLNQHRSHGPIFSFWQRAELFESLQKVQASTEELSLLSSTSDMHSGRLKRYENSKLKIKICTTESCSHIWCYTNISLEVNEF